MKRQWPDAGFSTGSSLVMKNVVSRAMVKSFLRVRSFVLLFLRCLGVLDTLRHFKDDVKQIRTGMECGLSFAEFKELKAGDLVQSFIEVQMKRKLN